MEPQDLIDRLETRLTAFAGGDASGVLSERAEQEALDLYRGLLANGDAAPVAVMVLLVRFHWSRYLALPAEQGESERGQAIRFLSRVPFADDPRIPEEARRIIDDSGLGRNVEYLMVQAGLLLGRATEGDTPNALDQAVALFQAAAAAATPGSMELAHCLSRLGVALDMRFDRSGDPADLQRALQVAGRAVQLVPEGHPEYVDYMDGFATVAYSLAERSGAIRDLNAAVQGWRLVVDLTPADAPERRGRVSNLSGALKMRYERIGELADLDAAIESGAEALSLATARDPRSVMYYANQTGAFLMRYERLGVLSDVDAAIAVSEEATEVIPPGYPNREVLFSNLAGGYKARFARVGRLSDLNRAIAAGQEAVDTVPPGHPDLAMYLSNHAGGLTMRFDRTGDPSDADAAAAASRQAVAATPLDHPRRATRLSNFATIMKDQFERTGRLEDIDEAINTGSEAVSATPPGHPSRALYLSSQGNALIARYDRFGEPADLDAAIGAFRQSVEQTPPEHSNHARFASNLTAGLHRRFIRSGSEADLQEAVRVGRLTAGNTSASIAVRIDASQQTADDLMTLAERRRASGLAEAAADLLAQALDQYRSAVELLPLLTVRSLGRDDQQYLLEASSASLGRNAAACAIQAGDPRLAVELLEQCRGVWWGQMLDLRTDLTALRETHPGLAEEFSACRSVLDESANASGQETDLLREAVKIKAAERFDELLAQIRALPPSDRFPEPQSFLRPHSADELLPPPGAGPVVILNVSRFRSDALIVTADGPDHLQLHVDIDEVDRRTIAYLSALHEHAGPGGAPSLEAEMDAVLKWLWDDIAEPVLDKVFGSTGTDGPLPRIWWSPTGALTLLPVHAAGRHAEGGGAVIDRAVSSYTPSLRALANARRRTTSSGDPKLLVVAVSETPGSDDAALSALPGAKAEQGLLLDLLGADVDVLADEQATRAGVTDALGRHRWVHIACHGTQNLNHPAEGGLVPFDWRTAGLIRIGDLTDRDRPGGEFAFLSACQTAIGGTTNLDEAVSLTSAMQHSGWRHVIGTLWTVYDRAALRVAEVLYRRLVRDGKIDAPDSARALHEAVRALRDESPAHTARWARFIHTGP